MPEVSFEDVSGYFDENVSIVLYGRVNVTVLEESYFKTGSKRSAI